MMLSEARFLLIIDTIDETFTVFLSNATPDTEQDKWLGALFAVPMLIYSMVRKIVE